MNAHPDFTQGQEAEPLDQGLNDLLAEAHERVATFVDDKLAKVQHTRERLARYRGGMQALFNEVNYTRECEATLGNQLLGHLPPQPVALTDASQEAKPIAPPQHKPGPADFRRVAGALSERLPRVLTRVGS
jgi:hypothetical protein